MKLILAHLMVLASSMAFGGMKGEYDLLGGNHNHCPQRLVLGDYFARHGDTVRGQEFRVEQAFQRNQQFLSVVSTSPVNKVSSEEVANIQHLFGIVVTESGVYSGGGETLYSTSCTRRNTVYLGGGIPTRSEEVCVKEHSDVKIVLVRNAQNAMARNESNTKTLELVSGASADSEEAVFRYTEESELGRQMYRQMGGKLICNYKRVK